LHTDECWGGVSIHIQNNAGEISANPFSLAYLETILTAAQGQYRLVSLREQFSGSEDGQMAIRLDLDCNPRALVPILDLAKRLEVPLTIYVRAFGPYNLFWYPNFAVVQRAARDGHDVGLHTAAVEWGKLNGISTEDAFAAEIHELRQFFDVTSVAPHRDVNYAYNTLPWIESNWDRLCNKYGFIFQAYDKRLFDNAVYINEGLSPHLGWRSDDPMDVIQTGKSIYMLIHPHWWYVEHPFELDG